MRIAVLTSGGDAPGMNAAIRAVVRTALDKRWDDASQLWVISRHEDVAMVSRQTERYCSKFGVRPKVAAPLPSTSPTALP